MTGNCFKEVAAGEAVDIISSASVDLDVGCFIESLLGQGSTANVYLARHRGVRNHDNEASGNQVVLKVLTHSSDKLEGDSSMLEKEAKVLAALQGHPNIIDFYGQCWVRGGIEEENVRLPCLAMQMEYCRGGDLHDKVTHKRFEENEARHVMQAIFRGLSHIHEHGYVHRDIKPENILWANGVVKISDFGLCCHTSNVEEMQRKCGSAGYIAPEVILGQPYGPNADCFGAGTLLYFIISGRIAYTGRDARSAIKKTLMRPLDFRKSMRLERLSEDCKEFMLEVTMRNPLHRPTSEGAFQSRWLAKGISSSLSEAAPIFDDTVVAARNFSREVNDIAPEVEPEICASTLSERRTDGMLEFCPGKSARASFDRLSDASTIHRETMHSRATSIRESENSALRARDESEGDYSVADNLFLEAAFEPTRPKGRPVKSRTPFYPLRPTKSGKTYSSKGSDVSTAYRESFDSERSNFASFIDESEEDSSGGDKLLQLLYEPREPEGRPVKSRKPFCPFALRSLRAVSKRRAQQ
jgi:serine/threonine protein kinase